MSWIGDLKDLINLRKDRQKTSLEIDRLKSDKHRAEARVSLISEINEIRRYDPKADRIIRRAKEDHFTFSSRRSINKYPIGSLRLLLWIAVLIALVWLFNLLVRYFSN